MLDGLVQGLAHASGVVIGAMGAGNATAGERLGDFAGLLLLVLQWYLVSTTGQSIGKRALGIAVLVILAPPLIVTADQIDEMLARLARGLEVVEKIALS